MTQINGKATLIGAGPGHPDLITVRGLNRLQTADVVLYDRLIPRELLDQIPATAEAIFVGKRAGQHLQPQAVMNEILRDFVQAGKQVVRLKGGDPFVFGRGGEEALMLREHGLAIDIIPGVTSAIAVPGYAGVPVTQKGVSTSFTVMTGHEDPTKPESMLPWPALAKRPTLVILMAVKKLPNITKKLIAAGKAADTPAIAISHGATDKQRTILGTLATLPDQIKAEKLPTPAIIVIGEVATFSPQFSWFQPDGRANGFVSLGEETGVLTDVNLSHRPNASVALVGAGPGAPDLITVRGRDKIRQADIILYDRLVDPAQLAEAKSTAELINVGKGPTKKRFPQSEINRLLIEAAQTGKKVVRLKGGDPFVFGLGGDECIALNEAGIKYEIVPGVSSVTAVPALAGIPVTHRGIATSFTVLTGHRAPDTEGAAEWDHLSPYSTLVVLMGVKKLPQIVDKLISNGRSPQTPIAVIESGSTTVQRVITGTLNSIVDLAADVQPPSLIVIGDVVRLHEKLAIDGVDSGDTAVWGTARVAPPM